MEEFEVGEYIIYVNGDRYELGRIKRLTEGGAFICYHEGETAAKTPFDLMHKLINGFTIKDTTIGGETFKESEDKDLRMKQMSVLDKIKTEIEDTGAYEQEVNGETEFLEGITYCLNIIDKYMAEGEDE